MLEQGDIVLIPVPFTDLSSHKKRPVIVISNNDYHHRTSDMIVVALTSNPTLSEYSFTITSTELMSGVLRRPSTVRVDKLYTLSQALVVRGFGRVKPEVLDRIRAMLNTLVSDSP